MRYIGSKAALLADIEKTVKDNVGGSPEVFCDLFAGTGAVGRHFKPFFKMVSNDLLHFSYVLQKAVIENNAVPAFGKLAEAGIAAPLKYLEECPLPPVEKRTGYFISENYAPHDGKGRMYLTDENAQRIDFARNTIDEWKSLGLIDESEFCYLLACIIEGVPFVSNITGTYGAYLKHWDNRAFKPYELVRLNVFDNGKDNQCYNMDAADLIKEIEGDILYIDPPYNSRQYLPNYHLLETISRNDRPVLKGVTGMRPYNREKSRFCEKKHVLKAFEEIIKFASFKHIIVSYNSNGIMSAKEIGDIMSNYGISSTFKRYDIPYRKYMSKIAPQESSVFEYLFYVRKDPKGNTRPVQEMNMPSEGFPLPGIACKSWPSAEMMLKSQPVAPKRDRKKYLKSPLNYIGGKYNLLSQIIPLFPKNINTFIDLFSGGANVAINVQSKNTICNDLNSIIIEMFKTFHDKDTNIILNHIKKRIQKYSLSKENKKGFLQFRDEYNKTRDPLDLYTLTCFSFNYQFRFNSKHEYNNPFGRNRSQFSVQMESNLVSFIEELKRKNIHFVSNDFRDFDITGFGEGDFIYCDPPYLITTGSYNDGKRGFKDWGTAEEEHLLAFLDRANARGIRFALSNVLEHKGRKNTILNNWCNKYRVVPILSSYSNSSYNTNRGGSKEVLILNYE